MINELYFKHSLAEIICSDNGANFNSKLIKKFYTLLKVKQINTTIYRPQSTQSERVHYTIKTAFKSFLEKSLRNWDDLIGFSTAHYNFSVHESTNYSPFEIIYGRTPRTITNIRETISYNYGDFHERL